MPSDFVHLHLHTEYSLVDGVVRIKPLVAAARAAGMPAVAVTDQGNLFAMVKFYRAAMAAGVQPILGVDAWVLNPEDESQPHRLVMLCQNPVGYNNVATLVSRSYQEGQLRGIPMLRPDWFDGHSDGIIAMSGGPSGDVGQALLAGREDVARARLQRWQQLFPDRYYLQLQRTHRPGDEDCLHASVGLATETGVPVVASNDVRFLQHDDFEAHEARVCIHEGRTLNDTRRARRYSEQQYLRSPEEMQALFADIPEALSNTLEIARRCSLVLSLGKNYLPAFPVPEGKDETQWFIEEAWRGLEQRLAFLFDTGAEDFAEIRKVYDARLQRELDVIVQMGFPGYFLIVADFIRWARENDVPVGPGRGSGAGSLVAYAQGITDLDPIQYDLLFERFLNPERVSLPDFDVDFCMEGRDRVIDYVARAYGRDRVSQIITYGSMAAKAVVRDVGRVMGHPYGFVDKLAKLIPFDLGITLSKALEEEPELKRQYDEEEDVRALIDMALKLEGLSRNAGKHAGGVVIAPSVLTDFCPLYCEQGGGNLVTQFDKDDVEAVGLVKFDFLGLRTLTIINWALRAINGSSGAAEAVEIERIPLDDRAAFNLLKAAQTTAVFQLESRGMKDLIRRLQPDCFEDIIALVALFRPGPLQSGMVDDFINRKHGRAKVDYPHPDLEPILKPTYGVILYQEQVMQIAQVLAGYTLGGADMLRRAMGKKKAEEMAKQRDIFVTGASQRGVEEKVSGYIFDLMEKFAGYGFNKSHSAAYALVSYQTLWLKAHHPAAFMAAVMSADMDNTDKVVGLMAECRDMHLDIQPPDVNRCDYPFTADGKVTVRYGLGAIKGVGQAAIEDIVEQRSQGGDYFSLFDFCARVDTRKLNRRALEALIRAGALDSMGQDRAVLMASLTRALQAADQLSRNQDAGQDDLFGDVHAKPGNAEADYLEAQPWSEEQRLTGEKETLGLYLTGHPIDRVREELDRYVSGVLKDVQPSRPQAVTVAGLLLSVRTIETRRGRMAAFMLDDNTARMEVTAFSDVYEKVREKLIKDSILVVEGEAGPDERNGGFSITAQGVYPVHEARSLYARRLLVEVNKSSVGNGFVDSLEQALQEYRSGPTPVYIAYTGDSATARLSLGEDWRVNPTDELLQRLRAIAGRDRVTLEY